MFQNEITVITKVMVKDISTTEHRAGCLFKRSLLEVVVVDKGTIKKIITHLQ